MKVVFASTAEQEQQIGELVERMYSDIFPLYFSDDAIKEFEGLNVLKTTQEYFGTLKEAYQVMSGLQTILLILEEEKLKIEHETIFNRNVQILDEFKISFPFTFDHFYGDQSFKNSQVSMYCKANNGYLL
ncbi:DUF5365 family protein [Cytobacillus purgationiresistens]|uniref:YhcU family protein n=1 Tax=Cytobacillus purgationiresistens TaxID=863449 RepID=A0ABU0AQS7_9BACI|nr:DUF5365 family protein [Cytobacillus purgationiresistens]MDQ0273628.1 hypothetical protein [Cytobacillus purgationiresistens]